MINSQYLSYIIFLRKAKQSSKGVFRKINSLKDSLTPKQVKK